MNSERWKKIQLLFEKALELKQADRENYLKYECADDKELFDEVSSLLKADENEHTIFSGTATDYISLDEVTLDGKIFGNYKALQQIGSGGMGTVYLAERVDGHFEQKVALKIVKPGMNTKEIISRFEDERRILAKLQHPNIARLLDGGVSDLGLPYFTMEYVEGKSIIEYCDENKLTIEQRLGLFKKVCEAVLYAHQNLVIHRDLKPSNILVQDDGNVKLLDFGIAKVFEEDGSERFVTRTSLRVMTPEYASPEQVRGQQVSTATDIYSLGLILYQLLTGYPPYEVQSTSALEMERAICLTEPQKPSTIISKIPGFVKDKSKDLTSEVISANRKTTSSKLRKRISGDLDIICLKAIRKEASERYRSIAEFISDIDNHINGLPIFARKGSAAYRTKKFIQRHKVGVTVTSIAVIVLTAVVFYYTIQLAVERDKATLEAEKSKKVAEFLSSIFKVADPENSNGETITARELLDNGVRRIENELSSQPEVLANMLGVTGNVYKSLGLFDKAKTLLEKSYELNDSLFSEDSPETAKSLNDLATLNFAMGDYDGALKKLNITIKKRQSMFGNESLEIAESINHLGMVYREQGKYNQSDSLLMIALNIRKKILPAESQEIAESKNNLGLVKQDLGKYEESKKLYEAALAIKEKNYGRIHPSVSETIGNFASLLQEMGKYDEASKLFNDVLEIDKKLYGDVHPQISTDLYYLASNKALLGDLNAAEELYSEVLELDIRLLGEEHPYVALDMNNLAGIYSDKGDYYKAEALYKKSYELNRKIYGDQHPEVATSMSNLGVLYQRWNKPFQAEPLLKDALDLRIRLLGEEHPSVVTSINIYAVLLSNAGKYKQAVEQYRKSLSLRIKTLGENHPNTALTYVGLGESLISLKIFSEAEETITKGLNIYKKTLPADHWNIFYAECILGKCYSAEGRYGEAEKLLLGAYKNLVATRGNNDRLTRSALRSIIKNYERWGKQTKANEYRALFSQADLNN